MDRSTARESNLAARLLLQLSPILFPFLLSLSLPLTLSLTHLSLSCVTLTRHRWPYRCLCWPVGALCAEILYSEFHNPNPLP